MRSNGKKRAMKLGLVTIIHNEQDILGEFLNHIDALFDYVLLIDHLSFDNSREMIQTAAKHRTNWRVFTYESAGFFQNEISKLAMSFLFERNMDAVFFLDADEFIQVKNRKAFEQLVDQVSSPPQAGCFRWNNALTELVNRPFTSDTPIWQCNEPSQYQKVFIPVSLHKQFKGKLFLAQGNHLVSNGRNNPLDTIELGRMIHIPIRSRRQLFEKVIRTALSAAIIKTLKPGETGHIYTMLHRFASGEMDDDSIRGCVHLYQKESKIIPTSIQDLSSEQYTRTSLNGLNIPSSHRFNPINQRLSKYDIKQILFTEPQIENSRKSYIDEKNGRIFIQQ